MAQACQSYQERRLPRLVQVSPVNQECPPHLEALGLLVVQLVLVDLVVQDHPLFLAAQHFLVSQHFQLCPWFNYYMALDSYVICAVVY